MTREIDGLLKLLVNTQASGEQIERTQDLLWLAVSREMNRTDYAVTDRVNALVSAARSRPVLDDGHNALRVK